MARTLPERTVEAWTTAYLVRWFPTADLWAPTQSDDLAWDLSAALPNRRHFVFEYKAVEGGTNPSVPIDMPQLAAYVEVNERLGCDFVWYVLPYWEHAVAPGQVMPAESRRRTLRAVDPRSLWATPNTQSPLGSPLAVPDDRQEIGLGRGCESYFYVVQPRVIQSSSGAIGSSGISIDNVPTLAQGLTLEHFLHLVDADLLGVTAADIVPALADAGPAFTDASLVAAKRFASVYGVTPGARQSPQAA